MTENDLKKLLSEELDKIAPSMSPKVKKAPIGESNGTKREPVKAGIKREQSQPSNGIKREPVKAGIKREQSQPSGGIKRKPHKAGIKKNPFKYKGFTIGSIAAVLVIAIVLSIALPIALNRKPNPPSVALSNQGYIQMDINPSVELLYDKDFKVTKVLSNNSDGDVLLNDQSFYSSLIGKNADEVATMIVKRSGELGFIKPEGDNVVRVISVNDDDTSSTTALDKIADNIQDSMSKMGVFCVVAKEKKDKSYLEEKFGTAVDNVNDALAQLQDKATNYFERISSDLNTSIDELQKYYEQQITETVRAELVAECNRIVKTRALLAQTNQLNDKIKSLSKTGWLGYWYYLDNPKYITAQIRPVFDKMTTVLDEISRNRDGATIDSEIDLGAIIATYKMINEQKLLEFGNKTLEEFKGYVGIISDMLKGANEQFVAKIEELLDSTVTDVQEFLINAKERVNDMSESLSEAYSNIFYQPRPAISTASYEQRYNAIIKEYGSIENYYASKHNK